MSGRPTLFTGELVEIICSRMAGGESIRSICADDGMPDKAQIFRWLATNNEFRDQYAIACEARMAAMAEEILEIADDGRNDTSVDEDGRETTNHDVIARSRLRVDTRKWLMSKLAPKKYGDKLELGSDPNKPLNIIHRVERVIVDPKNGDGAGVRTAAGAESV